MSEQYQTGEGARPTTPLWPLPDERPAPRPVPPVYRAEAPTGPQPVTGPPAYGPVTGPPAYGPPPGWQPPYPPPRSDAPRRGGGGRVFAALVGALMLALLSGVAGGLVVHRYDTSDSTPGGPTAGSPPKAAAPIDRSSLASIAAAAAQSVVDINTGTGEGSGVILTADGAILTNNHVVAGARNNTVRVTFSSGKTANATIVGTDPAGDLAVVKAQGVSGLTAARFGNSDALQPGDTVLALGSPLGLQGSVTAGIVSALHRTIDESGENGSPGHSIGDAIQTDAAINPGNSGGPLVNTAGEVVGINTAIATSGNSQGQGQEGNIGVGFAIPSNKAKAAADQLLKGGKVSHPFLGVEVSDADGGGALVANVTSGGPADKAGIQRGDVINRVGDKAVNNSSDLVSAVQTGRPGDRINVSLTRNGSAKQVTVTLAEAS
jgi:putative serine protease PepD